MRAHLEEDAAKTVHVGGAGGRIRGAERSLVDFNRGGTPLVEIVTQPDLRSADDARRFLQLLRQTVVELGISDAEMEKGIAALSTPTSPCGRPARPSFRTRTELKNMNSFSVRRARHRAPRSRGRSRVYEAGGEVVQETLRLRRRRPARSTPHRSKEEARGLPLLPRARPRAGRAAGRARRAACAASCPSCPARGSAGSRRRLGFDLARGARHEPAATRLYEAWSRPARTRRAAVERRHEPARARPGVDPAAVDARRARRSSSRRATRIPRAAFAEALAASGDAGLLRRRLPRRRAGRGRVRARAADRARSSPRTRRRSRRTAAARRACSASSSAR